jgi:hypothetical protein
VRHGNAQLCRHQGGGQGGIHVTHHYQRSGPGFHQDRLEAPPLLLGADRRRGGAGPRTLRPDVDRNGAFGHEFQGAVILAVIVWLIWDKRHVLLDPPAHTEPVAGLSVLAAGLALYFVGRSLGILVFQIGALMPILAGVLLAMRGVAAIRAYWFMLLFIIYLVPLPAYVQDAMTLPLKEEVSALAAKVMYAAGYPIAHEGVVITVGQYQLLVADACAGLNSMFSFPIGHLPLSGAPAELVAQRLDRS